MEETSKIEEKNRLNTNRPLVSLSNTTGKERRHEYDTIHRDKEKKRISDKKWSENNYEHKCQKQREYHHKNRERSNQKNKEWGIRNKEYKLEYMKKYHERTKLLRKYLPFYTVTKKETHFYF